ncbi:unnamed protein product, partial [Mesorhabditis belari]|uniref:non-specific serine/threonine protein kinase n=1 Tax=Mesorhabditis belari TaxID=2138241 RepID=A0AAF3FDH0_9BILA
MDIRFDPHTPPFEPRPKLKLGEFELTETLGSGTFGKVKVGVHEVTGYKVAIKMMSRAVIKHLDVANKIRREIQNLSQFSHPHIIQLYAVVSTPTHIFMVMEYVSGGELFEYIVKKGSLNTNDARRFFQQIISGVSYCHNHFVVHRDLKPENLLLDKDLNVKIADFGLSNMMRDGDFLRTSCGSPNYAAPEVISGMLYCGPEVDIWSCGVILFALLSGRLPFDDDHIPALFRKIKAGVFTIPQHFDQLVTDLLKRMLEVDATKRAKIHEIIVHPWFNVDLPGHLFPSNNETSNIIDIHVVRDLAKQCSVSEEELTTVLLSDKPFHHFTIAYNEMVKNKRPSTVGPFADEHSINFRSESFMDFQDIPLFGVGSPPSQSFLNASPLSTSRMSSPLPQRDFSPMLIRGQCNNNHAASPNGNNEKSDKWYLGIRSSANPADIMLQIFNTLSRLNFEWITVDVYHLIVRKKVDVEKNGVAYDSPSIALQLFKVRSDYYILDFKNVVDDQAATSTAPTPSDSYAELENLTIEQLQNEVSAYVTPRGRTMPFFEACSELLLSLACK